MKMYMSIVVFLILGATGCDHSSPTAPSPTKLVEKAVPVKSQPNPRESWDRRLQRPDLISGEDLHQALLTGAFEVKSEQDLERFSLTLRLAPHLLTAQDERGQNLAHWLMAADQFQLLKLTLDSHPELSLLEKLDLDLRSPLHLIQSTAAWSAISPHVQALQWAQRDRNGQTPLHRLASRGDWAGDTLFAQIVSQICRLHAGWSKSGFSLWASYLWNGNELNFRDADEHTALHLAAINNSVLGAEALVRCPSVDLDSIDHLGRTALHYAALKPDFLVGYSILANSAAMRANRLTSPSLVIEINTPDRFGKTALDLALSSHNAIAAEILKAYGARSNSDSPGSN